MAVRIRHTGDFERTRRFFDSAKRRRYLSALKTLGVEGVNALSNATPERFGITAASWGYRIIETPGGVRLQWTNSNENDGVSIAILIQYGHATGTGGIVEGRDYINPAMRPIFDRIADAIRREVNRL